MSGPFWFLIYQPLGLSTPVPVIGARFVAVDISYTGPRAQDISYTGPRAQDVNAK